MCRLAAITSKDYFSPTENITALETMKEGHDGSGMGLILKGSAVNSRTSRTIRYCPAFAQKTG